MNANNHLAQNLKNYKDLMQLTTGKLALELDIPKATLKNIMNEGNTTLHTVVHISRNLNVSLDMLVNDADFADKIFIMDHMQKVGRWFSELPMKKQTEFAKLMAEIWRVLADAQ